MILTWSTRLCDKVGRLTGPHISLSMFCCMSSVDSVWACAWPYPAALDDLHQTNTFVLALLRIVQAPAPRVQVTMLVRLSAFRDLVRYEDDTPRPLAYTSDHELANEMLGRSHAPCGLHGIATCAHARFMRFAGVHPRELMLSSTWLLFCSSRMCGAPGSVVLGSSSSLYEIEPTLTYANTTLISGNTALPLRFLVSTHEMLRFSFSREILKSTPLPGAMRVAWTGIPFWAMNAAGFSLARE